MGTEKNAASDHNISPEAIVITPTIGTPQLIEAMQSVEGQDFKNIMHFIVIDGEEYQADAERILERFDKTRHKKIVLPFNTGNGIERLKFNGHRIYAACSYLVNSKYVFFLDEDNWYDHDHVSSLIALIEHEQLDWAYSLRKIYNEAGEFITNDDCENLGQWPPFSGVDNVVDTNCYAFKREVLATVGHAWYHPLGADRFFYKRISARYKNFSTSSRYTVNYRLHDQRPPHADFFLSGNEYMLKKYGGNLPWKAT
jgi:hypothetical protein